MTDAEDILSRMQEYICIYLFADTDTFTHRRQHTRRYNAGLCLPAIRRGWFARLGQLQSSFLNSGPSHDDDDDAHYSDV